VPQISGKCPVSNCYFAHWCPLYSLQINIPLSGGTVTVSILIRKNLKLGVFGIGHHTIALYLPLKCSGYCLLCLSKITLYQTAVRKRERTANERWSQLCQLLPRNFVKENKIFKDCCHSLLQLDLIQPFVILLSALY